MKTHVRNLSASHKKTSYSTNASPSNNPQTKRERQDSFQIPDIKLNLGIVSRNPSKANETKSGHTNLFINNFNIPLKPNPSAGTPKQGLFIGKISNTQRRDERKYFSHGGNSAEDSYDRGVETSGRMLEKNPRENTSRITFSRSAKGTPVIVSKGTGRSEIPQSDFLLKLAKNTPDTKKYSASPRANMALDSSLKQQAHTKNKKSFDITTLYPQKSGGQFSESHMKPVSIANSSAHDDSPNKSKMPFNESQLYNFTSSYQQKAPTPAKSSAQNNVFKLENSLLYKHKRTSSHDATVTPKNDNALLAKPKMPDMERNRKSDAGHARVSGLHASDYMGKRYSPSMRFAIKTRAGATATGARKTNQDSYIALTNFGKNPHRYFFGICDGHGTNGHLVSSFVKETLPSYLLVDSLIESKPEITLTNAYQLCHEKLVLSDFDTKFSGTTCVTLLINGNRIISSNAGDSRAVMAFYDNGEWDCVPLSNDHKPNQLAEAQRILMAGGRIEAFRDPEGNFVGPSRVWLQNQNIPGLAMSRSIGDVVAASVGVTCRPEIKEFQITPEDKFIILASDGVWEFIDSMDAVKMVIPFYEQNNLEGACDYLMGAALKKWREEEEHVVDDITLIIIFL